MNFKIIVHISRNNLTFYYSLNKTGIKVFEYEGNHDIPLYFYSNGDQFSLGDAAKGKVLKDVPHSYHGYFDLIKDTKSKFSFYNDEERKYKHLLRFGIEHVINDFLTEIILTSDLISDLKNEIDLNLVFASDIKENEINLVGTLFKDEGYAKLRLVNYNYLLLNYLDRERKIGKYVGYMMVEGIDGDLHINFYEELIKRASKFSKVVPDLASNPKDKIIAGILYDAAVLKSGAPFKKSQEKDEINRLIPTARKYSNTTKSEFRVPVELSDGSPVVTVKIRMAKVKEILSYKANFTKDFDAIREVEQKSKISGSEVLIVARKSITSENLLDKLKHHYNNYHISDIDESKVLELFTSDQATIDIGDFLCESKKKSKPTVQEQSVSNNKDEANKTVGTKPAQQEVKRPRPAPPPPPPVKKKSAPPPPPPLPKMGNKTVGTKPAQQGVKRPRPAPPPPPPVKKKSVTQAKGVAKPPPPPPPPPPPRPKGK